MSQSIDSISSGNVTPLSVSDTATPVQTPEQRAVQQTLEERPTPIASDLNAARTLALASLPGSVLQQSTESTLTALAARRSEKAEPTPDEMRKIRQEKLSETVQTEQTDHAEQTRRTVLVDAPKAEQSAVEGPEGTKPNDEPVGPVDVRPEVKVDPDGQKIREVVVDAVVFALLKDYRNEIVSTQKLTLEEMQEKQTRIQNILAYITEQKKALTEANDTALLSAIELRFMEMQGQVDRAMTSRTHLNARLDDIADILRSSASTEEKIAKLCNFDAVWRLGQEQTEVLRLFLSGDITSAENLLSAFKTGIGMVNGDFHDFSDGLSTALCTLFDESFRSRGLTPPTQEAFRALVTGCFRTGNSPADVIPALLGGTAWASSPAHQADLLKVFFTELATPLPEGTPDARILSRRMACVDMIFQGASREFADTALVLKKMLCPGEERMTELQHQSLLVSRALKEYVLEHQRNSSFQRGAIRHMAHSSLSARSFLLTPELVQDFARASGLDRKDFNYHMAHAAVIQLRALKAGAFPEAAESHSITSVADWCTALGLDQETARYAARLDAELDAKTPEAEEGLRKLLGAGSLFTRGLEGELAGAKAGKAVVKQAKSTAPAFFAGDKENAFYQTSGNYLAHEALDRALADLTGILDDSRFAHETGFEHNAGTIRANMQERMERLMINMNAKLIKNIEGEVDEWRKTFIKELRKLQRSSQMMQDLATAGKELTSFREKLSQEESLLAAMKADKKLVRLSWPHKHPERLRIAETVLEIEELRQSLEQAAPEARAHIESQIGDRLESLRDVDPLSLTRSRTRDELPDMDILLSTMLPRARALHFFKAERTYEGIAMSEADLAIRSIKRSRNAIMEANRTLDKTLKSLIARFGSTSVDTIRKTITAAVLKAFTESHEDIARFNLRSLPVQERVLSQLRSWGMDIPQPLLGSLVRSTVESLINDDGTLREDRLRELAGAKLTLSGKRSLDSMKQTLREEENYSRFKAGRTARRAGARGLLDDARRRHEGVRMLMDEASLPGSGFVYSRERGINIDSGKKFSPIVNKNTPISVTNLSSPLSGRLKVMAKDSLMVSNLGEGGYQVLLKGGMAAALGATIKIPLPGVILPLDGDVHGDKEKGIALTFTSREDCEAFVTAFMDKEAGLASADKKHAGEAQSEKNYDPDIWRKASQIRFVHGGSVGGDIGIGAMFTLFSETLGNAPIKISSALTFKTQVSGGLSQSVEENALGQKITFSRNVNLTQIASIGAGATANQNYVTLKGLNKTKAFALAVKQDFALVTGEKGIMPDTAMTYEFGTGGLSGELISHMFMPKDVVKKINADPSFAASFDKLVTGLPPTARLSLKCTLKASVLSEIRELMARARGMGSDEERHAAQKKVSDLLASSSSYKPDRIVVRNATPKDISKNWSPGLMAFQIARERSFLRLSASAPLEIRLPD